MKIENNNILENEYDFEQTEFLNSGITSKYSDNDLLNYALYYAEIGYPVFPLHNTEFKDSVIQCSCSKKGHCENIAKHPRTKNGFKDASTDGGQVSKWWAKYSDANIGLVTGTESGMFVLDIDVKDGGIYSLNDIEENYQDLMQDEFESVQSTLAAISGSGGLHYYFKYILDSGVKSSAGRLGSGLDIRGDNGYIVAPPSNHPCGNPYQWFGSDTPILNAPSWLVYELLKAEQGQAHEYQAKRRAVIKIEGKVHEGQRQKELVRFVCGLVNSYGKEEILTRTLEKNKLEFVPPFPENHVIYQVDYLVKKYGRAKSKDMGLKK